jgi:signal transduction histidine kinase
MLEQNNSDNLQKLSAFFTTQRVALAQVFGELKAEAIMSMLAGISCGQQKDREEIGRSMKEQLTIVNHIQEILNIQRQYLNGHTALEKKQTDVRSLINDCMAMLYASIEKRSITISLDIPRNLPLINADRTRLMQVVLNVLKNSIEAIDINSDTKRISIIVRANKNSISLQVHDSGHGFDQATGEQIFVRGFTTKASGTGLGLTSCKSIIEGHDGTINISSDGFGKGATTTIEFKT